MSFYSFAPTTYKRNLVACLFNRARRICSLEHLQEELNTLTKILEDNGYPDWFIQRHSKEREKMIGPKRKEVRLVLPYKGEIPAQTATNQLRKVTMNEFPHVNPVIIYTTRKCYRQDGYSRTENRDPSMIVYQYKCFCGSSYVGRTQFPASRRHRQHIPDWLNKGQRARPRSTTEPDSSITRHLMSCPNLQPGARTRFFVLRRCTNKRQLCIVEALLIGRLKPDLCQQKETVIGLLLPW